MLDTTSLITKVMGIVAAPAFKALERQHRVIKLRRALDMGAEVPSPSFESVFAFAMLEYVADAPESGVELFQDRYIQEELRKAFARNELQPFLSKLDHFVNWNKIGDSLRNGGHDYKKEFERFFSFFRDCANLSRTPAEAQVAEALSRIEGKIEERLPSNPSNSESIDRLRWSVEYVNGSSLELIDGISGTRKKPNGHHPSLFPLETTIILGDSNKQPPFNNSNHTSAICNIPIVKETVASSIRCFLLVGCLRHFGGLHSPVANDFIEIYLNDHPIDGFEIRTIPEGQTDFFHQRPFPKIPKLHPFNMCENLYAWTVPITHFSSEHRAQILFRIASKTKWDIDYIGLMFETSELAKGAVSL